MYAFFNVHDVRSVFELTQVLKYTELIYFCYIICECKCNTSLGGEKLITCAELLLLKPKKDTFVELKVTHLSCLFDSIFLQ